MLTELRRGSYDSVPLRDIAHYWKQITHAQHPIDEIYSRADRGVIYGPSPIFEPITPAVIQRRKHQMKKIVTELRQSGANLIAQREAVAFDQITCLQCNQILPNTTTRFFRFEHSDDFDITVSKEGVARISPRANARYNHTVLEEETIHAFTKHTRLEAPYPGRIISLDVQQMKAFFENPFTDLPTEYTIGKTRYQPTVA